MTAGIVLTVREMERARALPCLVCQPKGLVLDANFRMHELPSPSCWPP